MSQSLSTDILIVGAGFGGLGCGDQRLGRAVGVAHLQVDAVR